MPLPKSPLFCLQESLCNADSDMALDGTSRIVANTCAIPYAQSKHVQQSGAEFERKVVPPISQVSSLFLISEMLVCLLLNGGFFNSRRTDFSSFDVMNPGAIPREMPFVVNSQQVTEKDINLDLLC